MTKQEEISNETKGILAILIAEIRECENIQDIKLLLDCWVLANDLHPEDVKTVANIGKVKEYIYGK